MRPSIPTVTLLSLLAAACVAYRSPDPGEMSGFLDDYSLLREGPPGDLPLVYRKPTANWKAYDKVILEPVTLWRSGRKSLDPVPEEDLLRLVTDFEAAVRRRLGEGFRLVNDSGPGVMRIRLAITQVRPSDPVLDVLTATGETGARRTEDQALHPETRRFIEGGVIEGEIRDAETDELLAQGIDRRRREGALPIDTWADVDRALDFWADRMSARLEVRAGRR